MRKLKLLLASVALLFGGGISVWAQTDVTSTYITNPSFEDGETFSQKKANAVGTSIPNWTVTEGGNYQYYTVGASGSITPDNDCGYGKSITAADGSKYVHIRHGWKNSTTSISQTLNDMPAGEYTLSVQFKGATPQDKSPKFKIYATPVNGSNGGAFYGSFPTSITRDGSSTYFENTYGDWSTLSYPFSVTSTGNVVLKIAFTDGNKTNSSNDEIIFDNVRLTYKNYTATLQSTIDRAKILYARTSDSDLNSAIATAQGVLDDVDNTVAYQTTINNAVTTLRTAISTAFSSVTLLTGENITFMLENAAFESSGALPTNITTAITDINATTNYASMQPVEGWTINSTESNICSGVFAYGATNGIGTTPVTLESVTTPVTGHKNAIGMLAGWGAKVQYKQSVTLPAGRYVVTVPVYNKQGGTAFTKNLIGFIEDGGTEHLATTKSYTVGSWTTTTIEFDLNTETAGYMSVGYTSVSGQGSGNMPRLFVDGFTITFTDAANAYAATKSAAQTTYDDATYGNVTGEEKTALYNLLNPATAPSTVSEYFTAIDNINAAVATFKAAKQSYDEYYYENLTATRLGTDVSGVTAVTSAETALTAAHEINVLNYAKVESLGYTDYASTIFGSWTDTNVNGNQTGQHWDGGSTAYFEQKDGYWSSDPWSMSRSQTLKLPAGSYVLKAAARAKSTCDASMSVAIEGGSTYTTMAGHHGDSGKGITTAGVASYDEGEFANTGGRGWEWIYIPFTLASQSNVTISFIGSCAGVQYSFMGFANVTFLTTEDAVKGAQLIQITDALATVPSGNMNATVKSTLDTKVAAAEAASVSNTQEELNTILTELNEAIANATTSIAEYTKISNYLTATNTGTFAGDYSTISTAITAGSYTNSVDGIVAVKSVRNGIFTSGMTANKDLTSLIDNPSFETVPDVSWTVNPSSDTGIKTDGVDGYTLSNIDGTHFFSTWWQGRPITQNIGTLQAGVYELKGVVSSDGGTIYITMNDKHEAYVETGQYKTGTDDEKNKTKEIGIEFNYVFTLDAAQEVTIGIVGGANGTQGAHKAYSADGYWSYRVDNFRLKYLGATDPTVSLDGKYVIKTGGNKIGRGTNEATEAKMTLVGVPVQITTDKAGISTLKFTDDNKYLFWNDEQIYTDGTVDPAKAYHKPYWRMIPVSGGYNILNTQTGKYLTTDVVTRSEVDYTILTLSETPAVWTLEDYQVDEKKAELAAAIAAAPATPTVNVGTSAFQIPQAQVDALEDAKTNGPIVYADADATLTEVEDAIAAFEAVDVVTLNVPSSSQAYNLIFNCDGHTYTGNAVTLIPNVRADQGLYGFRYTAAANANLAQACYFIHTTGNKYKIYVVDNDGNDRYITTQKTGYDTSWAEAIRTITDDSKALEIEIRPNGDGLYLLWNTDANKAIAHNGSSNWDMFTNNTANFQIVETTKPSITINTSAAGLGTVMLPFAVASLPDGVRAFTCGELSGDVLTLVEVDALEANKPYLIAGSWNEIVTGDAQGTALTYTEGLLTGVYTSTAAPVGSYVLQKNNDVVAFYKVADGKQPSVGAYRCYLTAPTTARALYFSFDDETTGINTIKALMSGETTIYNAAGAVVPSLQKGLNIIKMSDGSIRKVMVK